MFIYSITNLVNGKKYIGQSTRPLKQRIREHKSCFSNEDKIQPLYTEMRMFGFENFKFDILVDVKNEDQLDELEKFYILYYNSIYPFGYNKEGGGKQRKICYKREGKALENIRKGIKSRVINITDETRKIWTEQRSGEKNPMFGKVGPLCPNFGIKQTKEHIEKRFTEESKRKMSESQKRRYRNLSQQN